MEATLNAAAIQPLPQQPVLQELIPVAELELVNATEAGLLKLEAQAQKFYERGVPTNKEQAKELHDFIQLTVKARTKSLELAEAQAAPFLEKANAIMDFAKGIGERASKTEKLTRPLKKEYLARLDAAALKIQQEEAAKLLNRTQEVINLGMNWNGSSYDLGPHIIDAVVVKAAPDDKWATLITEVSAYRDTEIAKAEQLRVEAETTNRLEIERLENQRQQQEDERKRQQDVQDEIERKEALLQQREDEFNRQQQEIQAAALLERNTLISGRLTRMLDVGFTKHGLEYRLDEAFMFLRDELGDLPAADFEVVMAKASQIAAEKEVARLQQIKDDAAEKKAVEKAKQKADKERQARLAPDKKLMLALAKLADTLAFPDLANEESRLVQQEFSLQLFDAVKRFRSQIEAL